MLILIPTKRFATMKSAALLALALISAVPRLAAQTNRTPHVLGLDDGSESPQASLEDIAWLAGSWEGEAFGGTFEEVWTPPSNGSMVGLFKLMHDGSVSIYEIQTMTEEEGRLVWKVKHFNADFTAWEGKDEYVSFPLVKIEPGAAYFDGITLRRDNENLIGYLLVSHGDEVREERLVYRPVKGDR